MNDDTAAALRAPFPAEQIGKLPRTTCRACGKSDNKVCEKHTKVECRVCGNWMTTAHMHLDYVGHAEATDRLLQVDPEWSWEPVAFDDAGAPLITRRGNDAVLWIRLTVAGTTRLGVGIVEGNKFELEKQLISDALRNGAMRFGVALDLWAKSELHPEPELPPAEPVATKAQVDEFNARVSELDQDAQSEFVAWKADQGFPWPWPLTAFHAMEAKLEQIVGVDVPQSEARPGTAAASTPTTPAGDSDEPDHEPQAQQAGTDVHPSAHLVEAGASELPATPLDYLDEPHLYDGSGAET